MMRTFANCPKIPMTTPISPLATPVFSTHSSLDYNGSLANHAVHLWLLDINQFTADHYAKAGQVMSSDERERAQKFIRGKETYIASRWLLRTVLARYTGVTANQVRFLRTEKGKPYLPQGDIHFSLSHSGHWALLAVAKTELLGVDIEEINTTRDLLSIAENYYHPQEFAYLQTLDHAAKSEHFYRFWTLKEAFFKAIGAGISAGLEKIQFDLAGDTINAQIAPSLGDNTNEWQFYQWALTAQDYCALASKSRDPLEVIWFDVLSTPAFP
jgi:4'-phosphopantetheinyl transferase